MEEKPSFRKKKRKQAALPLSRQQPYTVKRPAQQKRPPRHAACATGQPTRHGHTARPPWFAFLGEEGEGESQAGEWIWIGQGDASRTPLILSLGKRNNGDRPLSRARAHARRCRGRSDVRGDAAHTHRGPKWGKWSFSFVTSSLARARGIGPPHLIVDSVRSPPAESPRDTLRYVTYAHRRTAPYLSGLRPFLLWIFGKIVSLRFGLGEHPESTSTLMSDWLFTYGLARFCVHLLRGGMG